jgi:hypothetical protein
MKYHEGETVIQSLSAIVATRQMKSPSDLRAPCESQTNRDARLLISRFCRKGQTGNEIMSSRAAGHIECMRRLRSSEEGAWETFTICRRLTEVVLGPLSRKDQASNSHYIHHPVYMLPSYLITPPSSSHDGPFLSSA